MLRAPLSALILCGILTLLPVGCAVARQHVYDQATLRLHYRGSSSVAVATQDQRTQVVSGEKAPDFVGYQRSGLGIPFDVVTASERPLAGDMTSVLQHALRTAGYRAVQVYTRTGQPTRLAIAALMKTGAQRLVMVRIFQWKADTLVETRIDYDVSLDVLDATGNVLARSKVRGSDNLGGSIMIPEDHAAEEIPRFFKQKMERLLNDPSVVQALAAPSSPSPPQPESIPAKPGVPPSVPAPAPPPVPSAAE
jgi:hypothetical protein